MPRFLSSRREQLVAQKPQVKASGADPSPASDLRRMARLRLRPPGPRWAGQPVVKGANAKAVAWRPADRSPWARSPDLEALGARQCSAGPGPVRLSVTAVTPRLEASRKPSPTPTAAASKPRCRPSCGPRCLGWAEAEPQTPAHLLREPAVAAEIRDGRESPRGRVRQGPMLSVLAFLCSTLAVTAMSRLGFPKPGGKIRLRFQGVSKPG